MPLPGSAESGWRNEVDAVSTCTRLLREGIEPSISSPVLSDIYPVSRRMSVSTIETYATTFERVKRISADCSSAEWIGAESNRTTWNNASLTSTNSDRFVLLTHLNTIHAHFLSARAVQDQPISPIRTSCATTYRISILMVLESFLDMDCDISPASRISQCGYHYESCHILDTTYPSTYAQSAQETCEISPRNYPYAHIYTTAPVR